MRGNVLNNLDRNLIFSRRRIAQELKSLIEVEAKNDEIVIRPMMYVALTYDHRIMDGRDAVSFLVRIKKLVEDPRQLLLGL